VLVQNRLSGLTAHVYLWKATGCTSAWDRGVAFRRRT